MHGQNHFKFKISFFPLDDTKFQINVKQVQRLINLDVFRQRRARQIRRRNKLQQILFEFSVPLISPLIKFCFAIDLPKYVLGSPILSLYSNSFADLTLHNMLDFRYVGMLDVT
jgi:hypothetical protein